MEKCKKCGGIREGWVNVGKETGERNIYIK